MLPTIPAIIDRMWRMSEEELATVMDVISYAKQVCGDVRELGKMYCIADEECLKFCGASQEEIQLIAKTTAEAIVKEGKDGVRPREIEIKIDDVMSDLIFRGKIRGKNQLNTLARTKREVTAFAVLIELAKKEYWPGYVVRISRNVRDSLNAPLYMFSRKACYDCIKIGGKYDTPQYTAKYKQNEEGGK